MQNEIGTGGKRQKTLRSSKSAATSINNLKSFTLNDIPLEAKISVITKKKEKRGSTKTKLQKHRTTETHVQKNRVT